MVENVSLARTSSQVLSAAMENLLQGPIDSCFLDEHLVAEFLEHGLLTRSSLSSEGVESQLSAADSEGKIPFLQMLQCVESPPFLTFKEPNFMSHMNKQIQTQEPQSCVTHEFTDQNPTSVTSCREGAKSGFTSSSPPGTIRETDLKHSHLLKPSDGIIKVRRRKRTRAPKNQEDVESQRMTHIAVERNRRRQMNDHLTSLKSLMPPSYVQRGDQASIIGGAIDFIKELEQLLLSLVAEKRIKMGKTEEETKQVISSCSYDSSLLGVSSTHLFQKIQEEKIRVERSGDGAEIEIMVIQNHVNLKVRCKRRQGQLLRAIVSLEDLRLHVLHLNVTSSQNSVFYSFNIKMEDDCKLVSGDEIASAVHQIFTYINGS